MKDDEVWEKRETNIYVQMKPAEKIKEAARALVRVRVCLCVWVCACIMWMREHVRLVWLGSSLFNVVGDKLLWHFTTLNLLK